MKASIVDLRYRMKDVLSALDRNEPVIVLHRGKVKGTIVPAGKKPACRAIDHPFFGSAEGCEQTVEGVVDQLRGDRFSAL